MSNVGRGGVGKVYTGKSNLPPSFLDIGTGSSLTDNGVIVGAGTGAFTATAAGTTGQVLMGNTGADPSFQAGGSIFATTYRTDSGQATPSGGVLDVLGGPGVTVTATGSTITINSVTYTDQPLQVTAASDSGSFMTNAGNIILDLPTTPIQGELIEIVCTTAFLVAVDVPAADFIRIGSLITSSGGTATSTAIGDSLTLRFCFSTQTWYAISVVGTWVMA